MSNVHYKTRLYAKNSKIVLGGASPSPDPSLRPHPFGSYEASIFAPAALMLGAFGLHPRTVAQGEVEVGEYRTNLFL